MYVCEKCKWRKCRRTEPVCKYGLKAKFVYEKVEEKEKPNWLEGVLK